MVPTSRIPESTPAAAMSLATAASPGEEIYLTGIAGAFPDSDSVQHLAENLFKKALHDDCYENYSSVVNSYTNSTLIEDLVVDLISNDNRRWKKTNPEIPHPSGKLNELDKLDAAFFGLDYTQVNCMDPQARIVLEKAYECIIDAGVNPVELHGTKAGVFLGVCQSETQKTWFYEKMEFNKLGVTGCSESAFATRISKWLGVTGPSYVVDTACSSSLSALEHALAAIRNGRCDSAIVGGTNVLLNPLMTLQFARLGVLSPDGACKSFDERANGYVRSEAVACVFLQKAKDSRRVYAQLVHAKTNCDGYKVQGITYPSGLIQRKLLQEFYDECQIPPSSIEYVEAHGTGELPLAIRSTVANSLQKIKELHKLNTSSETTYIKNISSMTGTQAGDLEELKAIDETFCKGRSEPLLIGSVKSNLGHSEPSSGVCSLAKVCIAYNTGYITPNINFVTPRKGIAGFEEGRLKVVSEKTPWNRGMVAVNNFGFGGANAHVLLKNVASNKVNKGIPADNLPRLVCVSGRTECAVGKILDDLESRPVDVEQVRLWHAIHAKNIPGHEYRGYVLLGSDSKRSIRLARDIQTVPDIKRRVWFLYSGLGTNWPEMAWQLMSLPVFASSIQKCQTILERKGFNLIKLLHGTDNSTEFIERYSKVVTVATQIALTDALSAVGIKFDYVIGYHVGKLSGAYADGSLTLDKAILAAYSIMLASGTVTDKAITETVGPGHDQTTVLFEEASQLNPSSLVVVEMGPEILPTVFNRNGQGNITRIPIINNQNNLQFFLQSFGKLFEAGLNPQLANIYPGVHFPVSQGTSMLSHLVEWDHRESWFVSPPDAPYVAKTVERTVEISLQDENCEYLDGHRIDGRVIYPATGYLVLVWETLAQIMGVNFLETSVVFEDVYFQRATNMPKEASVEFTIIIQKESGNFEITEGDTTVVVGKIYAKNIVSLNYSAMLPSTENNEKLSSYTNIMKTKDFYKELSLRGYQHCGQFRGVLECSIDGTHGILEWSNNWVTFLDYVLQAKLVTSDTRSLYIPTRIEKISIDVKMHNDIIAKQLPGSTLELPLRIYPEVEMIRCGGAEIRGIHVKAISKKQPLGIPVFEKNEFMPNYSNTVITYSESLRSKLQLILENVQTYKVKAVEFVDEEYTKNDIKPSIGMVGSVLADLPLIQAELLVLSQKSLELPSTVTIANKKLSTESNVTLFIGANLLSRPQVLKEASATLKKDCFILSRESSYQDEKTHPSNVVVVTVHRTEMEYLVLMKLKPFEKPTKYIEITTTDQSFAWINKIKVEMKDNQKLVLYNENEAANGLLGFVNCLRKEVGGDMIQGLLIADSKAPKFNPDLSLYKEQLQKDLAINVFKNGQWGTYRHLLLRDLDTVPAYHAYVNTATIGDLTSLRWWEGSIRKNQLTSRKIIHVYSSAINFRDVMTAMGRVTLDAVARGRLAQDCVQGIEVSGRITNGSRVMAICEKGLSNMVLTDETLMWPFPDEWSFEEAATIPIAYGTVYLALVMVGKVRRGESILIHAGSGGVGQAAISVALHHGLEVFTTVGTPSKRAFIKKLFPKLKDSHIGNSRDTSFEHMIRKETNGKGVDVVLNSLSDDKLQASAKCLRNRGRFLEIGKYDITINTQLEMCFFKKEISFHGIMLDYIPDEQSSRLRMKLRQLVLDGIASGAVRPLTYCVFEKNEIEAAYRYMAAGKHIGKVIIKIRDEEPTHGVKPTPSIIKAIPRYTCHKDEVYVLIGGLGGFGLELADWLVLRGARKLVMSSRRGVSNGYQAFRLRIWESYGTEVQISTHDVTTEKGCEEMLKMANTMGPVKAIFNLAVILNDAVFTNQTPETFQNSFGPKASTTIYLDKLTRKMCPHLQDLVIFSSVSCGRGNAGQTNYGFSNSVMERVCEERKSQGLPALAIQWGAIGDVGLVADMQEDNQQLEVGGTLQQHISSCLQAMDKFLKQDAAIVSSIVVAEKRAAGSGTNSIVDAVAAIMGIPDLKTVSQQVALSELGMDSIMAVEIKQTLEREFEIFLAAQEIRTLTLHKLLELTAQNNSEQSEENTPAKKSSKTTPAAFALVNKNLGTEKDVDLPYIEMPTLVTEKIKDYASNTIFMLPGLEGCAKALEVLCSKLNAKACVMQLGTKNNTDTIQDMVEKLYKIVKPKLNPKAPFYLLGYSFGTIPILALAAKLESEGHVGVVFCVDGSPTFLTNLIRKLLDCTDQFTMENSHIAYSVRTFLKLDVSNALRNFTRTQSYEEKLRIAMTGNKQEDYTTDFLAKISLTSFNRLREVLKYDLSCVDNVKSPVILLRTKNTIQGLDLDDYYGLDKIAKNSLTVHRFDADHVSIVDHDGCADIINKIVGCSDKEAYTIIQNIVSTTIDKKLRFGS